MVGGVGDCRPRCAWWGRGWVYRGSAPPDDDAATARVCGGDGGPRNVRPA